MRQGIIFVLMTMMILSCKSEYEKLVLKEKASGIVHDSLYLGMKLGMTRQQFFEACAALNKDSILQQGRGVNVYQEIPLLPGEDSTKRKQVNFFAIFDEAKIVRGMQFSFGYISWSPWVSQLHSDKLVQDLRQRIEHDYRGNKFMEVDVDGYKNKILVKLDGSRRMLMYPLSNQEVRLKIEDLNAKLKKTNEK